MRHARYDSIIVGARCAGAATARLLAHAGQRVLVIDRGDPADDPLSTHALMRPAVLLLQQWGVLDRVIAATPAVRSASFHYGDAITDVPIKPRDGIDALYAPRRTVLDPLLVDAARAAGADVHHHTKLIELVRDSKRVCGAVVECRGVTTFVRADLVIGADGLGSAVARGVDAPTTRTGQHATSTIYAHVSGLGVDGYQWHYRPGVSAGVIPTNEGACVFAIAPSARFRTEPRDPDGWFRRVLAEAAPSVAARLAGVPLALRPFRGRTGYLRRGSGAGWALVGDAGFFRDPVTAHGITDALRDASLLARAVVAGDLARYAAARDSFAIPILEVTDAIASFRWNLEELGELHRTLNREIARELELVRSFTPAEDLIAAAS